MSRRIYCAGTDRPCPAHAWFYYSGSGRPVERCSLCAREHHLARKRGNAADHSWKLRVVAAASVSQGER
jgi:hypothetical protein